MRARRSRATILTIGIAVLSLLATAPAPAHAASGPGSAGTPGTPGAPSASEGPGNRHLASLDDAVAAGLIDRNLVQQLRQRQPADAFVNFDVAADLVRARSHREGKDRDTALTTEFTPSLRSKKSGALTSAGAGVERTRDFDRLPVIRVRVHSEEALLRLIEDGAVAGVTSERTYHPTGMVSDAESLALVRPPAGATGAGTYVAVIDTGVNYTVAPFGCTAVAAPTGCKVSRLTEISANDGSLDDDGHGTNVAGIIANVAPGTRILGYDVFTRASAFDAPSASDTDILAALNDILTLRSGGMTIRAVNMSLGNSGSYFTGDCLSPYTNMFATLRGWNVLPVVAAGNSAYDNGSSTTNGDEFSNGISEPGCVKGALSVGALYDSNVGAQNWHGGFFGSGPGCTDNTTSAGMIACFSQSGQNLDIWAPGAFVDAAGIQEAGTSQATPHVAGAAAILAAAKSTATADQIENALVRSGPTVYDARNGVTKRRLDITAARNALLNGAGDTAGPVLSPPTQAFQSLSTVATNGLVNVTVSWAATDPNGIASYELWASTNNGAFTKQALPSATATEIAYTLAPGTTYQFATAATDGAGLRSAYAYGPKFAVTNVADSFAGFHYAAGYSSPAWTRVTTTTAVNGTLTRVNGAACSTDGFWDDYTLDCPVAQYTFTGRAFRVGGNPGSRTG